MVVITLENKIRLIEQQIDIFVNDLKDTDNKGLRSQLYDLIRRYNREYYSLTGKNYVQRIN
jgi:hypothetical protein